MVKWDITPILKVFRQKESFINHTNYVISLNKYLWNKSDRNKKVGKQSETHNKGNSHQTKSLKYVTISNIFRYLSTPFLVQQNQTSSLFDFADISSQSVKKWCQSNIRSCNFMWPKYYKSVFIVIDYRRRVKKNQESSYETNEMINGNIMTVME